MSRCKFLPVAIFFLLTSSWALGQAARSPFSATGLGDQYGSGLNQNLGMGGVGVSNYSYWRINNMNPALLVFNRLTSFQLGLVGEQRTQTSSTNDVTEKSGNGNLNYLALAIPIKLGKWTAAAGLQPYSRLNYRLSYQETVGANIVTNTESGTGGVNGAYISNGVAINESISVGLKGTYLFGSTDNLFTNVVNAVTTVVSPAIRETTFVKGFQLSPAVSVHLDSLLGANYLLNFGAVYDFGTTLNAKFSQWQGRYGSLGNILDSTTLINEASSTVRLPQAIAVGVSFGNSYKWILGLDGYYADYSGYRDITGSNPYGSNLWRISGGFEITPDPQSLTSYLKRATYRTGVSLENSPYLVNGAAVRDFGITFGLSLPVSRSSSLDLGLKLGKKGDKTVNTIEENYLKLYFGITFNDQWFIKRKFD
jgi:hypothetical protein